MSTTLTKLIGIWISFVGLLPAQPLISTGSVRLNMTVLQMLPTLSGGAIVGIEKELTAVPVIHSFDESGTEMQPIALNIPGSKAIQVHAFARGADGAYAICGRAFDGSGRNGGFLTWISPDHQTVRTIQPFPYIPYMITIAPDGSIWTVGAETVNGVENNPAVSRSHGVVRHFSRSGSQIADFIPRSSVFHGRWMGLPQGILVSNRDRIGWYAKVAQSYIEMTFDGEVNAYAGIFPPGSKWYVTGLTLLDSGDVLASAQEDDHEDGTRFAQTKYALYRFDRLNRTWIPVAVPAGARPVLCGGDGKRILLSGTEPATFEFAELKK